MYRTLPLGWRDFLDTPITEEELKAVVSQGTHNKAPGRDGICLEIFKVYWDSIKVDMLVLYNQIYLDGHTMEQKHSIMMYIVKTDTPPHPQTIDQ